jgi:amino acid transporter
MLPDSQTDTRPRPSNASNDSNSGQRLRGNSLSFVETIGQSIANIAPTLTPALNISVVVAIAGAGAWLSYLIATIGLIFVAANIGVLARRNTLAGSYFLYIGRSLGALPGMLAGWSMVSAYLFTGIAASISAYIFLTDLLHVLGLERWLPAYAVFELGFICLIWTCAYRDVRLSSRLGLVLEALSLAVIVVITAIVVIKRGSILDSNQLQLQRLPLGRVTSALTLAVFSFVGFESSTTLAREARNPLRAIPRAVILSATISGVFFVATACCMILAVDDRVSLIGGSTSPFAAVTQYAGLNSAAAVVYCSASISSLACTLACVNAVARMLFSMGRYQFVHSAMGKVHQRYQSPHVAVSAACVFSLTMVLLLAHTAPLDAFGYAATFGTFGFLTVYLLTCIVAPLELFRAHELSPAGLATGIIGVALMAFVLVASVVTVTPYPYSLLPYIFIAYLALGGIWYGTISVNFPDTLKGIHEDLEA